MPLRGVPDAVLPTVRRCAVNKITNQPEIVAFYGLFFVFLPRNGKRTATAEAKTDRAEPNGTTISEK